MDQSADWLREVGEGLTSEGSDADRSWRRFLDQSPEAVAMLVEIRTRRASILERDPPPPEFFPEWTLKDRYVVWADIGDLRIKKLWEMISNLRKAFDPVAWRKSLVTKGYGPDEIDRVSYNLFMRRLPNPLARKTQQEVIEEYLEEIRSSTPAT